jgi:hypothetical protein
MKIAFKLSTPEAVEYALSIESFPFGKYKDQYFHIPALLVDEIYISDKVEEGYTDVTKDFKETYWRPWKEGQKMAETMRRINDILH